MNVKSPSCTQWSALQAPTVASPPGHIARVSALKGRNRGLAMSGSRRRIKPSGPRSDSHPEWSRSAPCAIAGFRRLATSYTLNELGWGFGTVALSLLVFDHTHSALATTGAVAVHAAGPRLRRPGGHRAARPPRRPPRAALALPRRGRDLRGAGAAHLVTVAAARARPGRGRRDPRARRARADARGGRRHAQARRPARGRQHAAERVVLALLRHRPGHRRPGHRGLGRRRRAVGQRRASSPP